MKKIICKREYDTETATLVKKHTVGEFGDPAGYEETLYQTPGGLYFLYFRAALHLPMPRRTSSAWPRQGGRLGRIPLSVQYAVRKPPEAGMVPPSGAFRLFGHFALGKGDASYA